MQISIEQIERTVARMVDAWDRGDATAYASQFTEDATYVIFAGIVSHGREAIRRDHVPVLTKWKKGSRMRVSIKSIRHISEDTAVVLSEGGFSKRAAIPLDKVQTFVFARQDSGEWLCAAFQNTKKNKLMTWFNDRASNSSMM